MNFILYDQFFFETEFDFDIVEEIAYANFAYMNLKKGGDHPGNRDTPEYNPEGISAEDYEEFWSYANIRTQQWLDYFNAEVFGYGVPLPYWNLEFLTNISFHPRALLVVLDLYYNV
jgi:hypothetical protein